MPEATPCQLIEMLGVRVMVKREDLNHPIVQGNKLWKLKYNLNAAQQQNAETVVTFGGAYSNHLLACAYAANQKGLQSVGVVRGDELQDNQAVWSETLHRCQEYGMRLIFVNRKQYRAKHNSRPVQQLLSTLKNVFVIPEGGSNQLAVAGVAAWVDKISEQLKQVPSHVICPVGTGGTLAGLIVGVTAHQWDSHVIGVAVLKATESEQKNVIQWISHLAETTTWELNGEFHGGGYAKSTPEMIRFGVSFTQQHDIPLDKIYNIKSFYALAQLIKSGQITARDHPLIIHTGGLQGGVV